ncbi:MAG: Asp-tRNA(Asn)/Glu-tRNA(Gln) amidotransferase subunit GatC [Phycisphaerales bacterium]
MGEAAALSASEVRKVAKLSRLALTDDQVEVYRGQLAAVLKYVERLRKVDLTGPGGAAIEPLVHVGDATNRLDDDAPGQTLPTQTLMKMAPESLPPFVKVPRVMGDGGA